MMVMGQVSGAIGYCHELHVCHRDIKPGNITVLSDEPFFIKIVDFGFAVQSGGEREDACGTFPYMAPEVVYSAITRRSYNGFCHDVWCIGIIVVELLAGLLCIQRALGWRKIPKTLSTGHADEISAYFADGRASARIVAAACGADAEGLLDLLPILKGMLTVDMNLRWGMRAVIQEEILLPVVARSYPEGFVPEVIFPKLDRRRARGVGRG